MTGSETTLELRAVRVLPTDAGPLDALDRVFDPEMLTPEDDATWEAMQDLARRTVGDDAASLTSDREGHSIKSTSGAILVDVMYHGQLIDVYFRAGENDDEFAALMERLSEDDFTVVQGEAARPVSVRDNLAELVAAQEEEMSGW